MKNLWLFGLLLFISCKQPIKTKAEAAMQQYDNLILHTDAKGISQMFTNDGEMASRGSRPIRGRDSIEKFLEQFKDVTVQAQQSTTDSVRHADDSVYQYGKYYQRTSVNKTILEIHGTFEAKWIIQSDGKLLLKRMSAWSVNN